MTLRGRTKGSKNAAKKSTGRCRFVVDEQHFYPLTSAGRDDAESKAISLAKHRHEAVRIDVACAGSMSLGPHETDVLRVRAIVARCKPQGCAEALSGLSGRRKKSRKRRRR